jgi:ligand-binding SRPBCC domain-containing protein
MRYSFHTEQWLPYPVEQVFSFFANPENLPRLMPLWQDARIEKALLAPAPPRPPSVFATIQPNAIAGSGTLLTLSFRPIPLSPVRISWQAEIRDFAWNDHFCDHQLRGPFLFWHHCHTVKSHHNANQPFLPGTLLLDHVDYELPLGGIGRVANRLFVSTQLRRIFDFRHARTLELLAL